MIKTALESLCDELSHRAPESLEPILLGHKNELSKQTLQQDPEQFVNQYLVWPICDALSLDYISEWYHGGHGGSIDLYIRNTPDPIFVECKRPNHYKRGLKELREYLNHRTAQTKFGIATDGINWIFIRDPGDKRKNATVIEYHSFRGAMFDYLASEGTVRPQLQGERVLWNSSVGKVANAPYSQYGQLRRVPIEDSVETFRTKFSLDTLSTSTSTNDFDETITTLKQQSADQHPDTTLDDFN